MLASMLMTSLTIIVLLVVTFDDGDGGWRARWWWETRLQRSSRSPDTEGHSWHDNDTGDAIHPSIHPSIRPFIHLVTHP